MSNKIADITSFKDGVENVVQGEGHTGRAPPKPTVEETKMSVRRYRQAARISKTAEEEEMAASKKNLEICRGALENSAEAWPGMKLPEDGEIDPG